MRIFVAGASGAIGRPLVAELVRQGHIVTGMSRSEAGVQRLRDLGATVAQVSAFDAPEVERAIRESRAEVIIDELTALPQHPSEMATAAAGDRKLRLEGGGTADDQVGCGATRQGQDPRQLGSSRRHAADAHIRSHRRSRRAGRTHARHSDAPAGRS